MNRATRARYGQPACAWCAVPIATMTTSSTWCCSSTASGGHGRAEINFTRRGRRGGPVPLRPHPVVKPKGRPFAEPLLGLPRGALVHFAVSPHGHDEPRLVGRPFPAVQPGRPRRGRQPANGRGHRTAYLWGRSGSATAGWRSSPATWWRSATKKASCSILFPALPPARRHPQAGAGGAAEGRAAST